MEIRSVWPGSVPFPLDWTVLSFKHIEKGAHVFVIIGTKTGCLHSHFVPVRCRLWDLTRECASIANVAAAAQRQDQHKYLRNPQQFHISQYLHCPELTGCKWPKSNVIYYL